MTRALLFDLGNVLVAFDFSRGYHAIEPHCSYRIDEIRTLLAGSGLVAPYERGELTSRRFFERLSELLKLRLSYGEFRDLWSTIFLPDPILPEELLVSLRQRYRLVLVSNTNEIHFRMIQATYPVVRHFDALVLSYEVGAMKPSERMYEEAVRQAGCRPEECFYTDDVLEFVEGGRRYGLDAVQFTGAAALEKELERRGINHR